MNLISKKFDIPSVNAFIRQDAEEVVRLTEESFAGQISRAADSAFGKRIVLLAGPSGSGKTTTAWMLCNRLRRMGKTSMVISLDDFYVDRKDLPVIDGKPNAEVVESLNLELLRKTINDVLDDGKTVLPRFDFVTGVGDHTAVPIDVGTDSVLIFEGLHGLNPLVRQMVPQENLYGIYVSPHSDYELDGEIKISRRDMRFLRRMIRDRRTRGASPVHTYSMWEDVRIGEDEFIRPFAKTSDIHINSTHIYEPGLMRADAWMLLSAVPGDSGYRQDAERLMAALELFDPVDKTLMPDGSLLREFMG